LKKYASCCSLIDIKEIENERKLFEVVASIDALTDIANRLKLTQV